MKKLKLTPWQNRILRILEEAGEETVETVWATLRAGGERCSAGEREEEAWRAALDGLRKLGLVFETGEALILTEKGTEALRPGPR